MSTWAVYVYRDAEAAPVYVGRTNQLEGRHEQHERQSPWWPEVAAREVDSHHVDLESAEARERTLIEQLRPRHNRAHNPSWHGGPPAPRRFRTDGAGLRRRRKELGETQRVFAERCGIGRSALAHAETGERDLTVTALMLVARHLGVSMETLVVEVSDETDVAKVPA